MPSWENSIKYAQITKWRQFPCSTHSPPHTPRLLISHLISQQLTFSAITVRLTVIAHMEGVCGPAKQCKNHRQDGCTVAHQSNHREIIELNQLLDICKGCTHIIDTHTHTQTDAPACSDTCQRTDGLGTNRITHPSLLQKTNNLKPQIGTPSSYFFQ